AAMDDGIGERLPQRQLNLIFVAFRAFHLSRDLHNSVHNARNRVRICRYGYVQLAGRTRGQQSAQTLDVLKGVLQFEDGTVTFNLSSVTLHEGAAEFD